jgi:toxin FitB
MNDKMHLVDTNVISELARPRPNRAVMNWFDRLDGFVLSAVSVEQLAFAVARAPDDRRDALWTWLDAVTTSCPVLPITVEVARMAGDMRAAHEARGRRVTTTSMLIAATARQSDLVVATRHVDQFADCGVEVESPYSGSRAGDEARVSAR